MEYDKTNNYIGNSDKQKEYTKHIFKGCSALNYTSFCHDVLYGTLLFNERNYANTFMMKILFDLVFLLIGLFRSIFKLQFHSFFFVILGYFILLVSSFYPPVWYRRK